MAKKKRLANQVTYKKGTELTNIKELLPVLERASKVFMKQQTIYDDETQSMTIEIHFK